MLVTAALAVTLAQPSSAAPAVVSQSSAQAARIGLLVKVAGSSGPSSEASATPSSAACPAPFSDVPSTNPFCLDIKWLKDNGITKGFGDGTYRPFQPTTRGEMAAFVRRKATVL